MKIKSKRFGAWTFATILGTVAIILICNIFGKHTVALTEGQINEQLQKQVGKDIPLKGTSGMVVKKIHITKANVKIVNDQVLASVDVNGTLRLGKGFELGVQSLGTPSFTGGSFYFKPEKVELMNFSYNGAGPAEAITKFADKYVPDKKQKLLTTVAPKVEDWITDAAEGAAVTALEKRPVYTLKNDLKGIIIKSSLESVKVDGGKMIITFTLLQLTISVLWGLIILIIAIAVIVFLIRNPGFGDILMIAADVLPG